MNTSLVSSVLERLCDRASMMKAVRSFFEGRYVLEVDTPILTSTAPIDPHIDILETEVSPQRKGYFHSSPEYGMKKLLAKGFSNIYQLSHVYRKGEIGPKHAVEFSMIEWYRSPFSFAQLVEETRELISLFLGDLPYDIVPYGFLLENVHGINPLTCSLEKLSSFCQSLGFYEATSDRDIYLSFLWDLVEPHLGKDKLTFVTHFPASQAALSNTFEEHGLAYAARFETYHKGLELANGYHELTHPEEQKKRLEAALNKRASLSKPPLPLDENLIKALENLRHRDFYGVAVGFDRLMMLRHKVSHIQDILPLSWDD